MKNMTCGGKKIIYKKSINNVNKEIIGPNGNNVL